MLTGYRNGDMTAPQLDTAEALRSMAKEFISSIAEQRPSLTDGHAGYRVVRMLEAAQRSMDENGRLVVLKEVPQIVPRMVAVPTEIGTIIPGGVAAAD
jgi:SpoVK/Ycf46/Vps4 family AAA+-type ATPase